MSEGLKISQLEPALNTSDTDKLAGARENDNISFTVSQIVSRLLDEFPNLQTLLLLSEDNDNLFFNGEQISKIDSNDLMVISSSTLLSENDLGKIIIVNPISEDIVVTLPDLSGDWVEPKRALDTTFIRIVKNDYSAVLNAQNDTLLGFYDVILMDFPYDTVNLAVTDLVPKRFVVRFSDNYRTSTFLCENETDMLKADHRIQRNGFGDIILANDITLSSDINFTCQHLILKGSNRNVKLNLNNFKIYSNASMHSFKDFIISGDKATVEGENQLIIHKIPVAGEKIGFSFNNISLINISGKESGDFGNILISVDSGTSPSVTLADIDISFNNCMISTPVTGEDNADGLKFRIIEDCSDITIRGISFWNIVNGFNKINLQNESANYILGVTDSTALLNASHFTEIRNIISLPSGAGDVTIDVINDSLLKTLPVDGDVFPLSDSASANSLKKTSWLHIKNVLKDFFDDIYSTFNGSYEHLNNVPETFSPDFHGNEAHDEDYVTETALSGFLSKSDFDYNPDLSENLFFAIKSGAFRRNNVLHSFSAITLELQDNATLYVEADITGVSFNSGGFATGRLPLYVVVTSENGIANIDDKRSWLNIDTIAERRLSLVSDNELNAVFAAKEYLADTTENHVNIILPEAASIPISEFTFRHHKGTNALTVYKSSTDIIYINGLMASAITLDTPGQWFTIKKEQDAFYVSMDSGLISANIIEIT